MFLTISITEHAFLKSRSTLVKDSYFPKLICLTLLQQMLLLLLLLLLRFASVASLWLP